MLVPCRKATPPSFFFPQWARPLVRCMKDVLSHAPGVNPGFSAAPPPCSQFAVPLPALDPQDELAFTPFFLCELLVSTSSAIFFSPEAPLILAFPVFPTVLVSFQVESPIVVCNFFTAHLALCVGGSFFFLPSVKMFEHGFFRMFCSRFSSPRSLAFCSF